jgi:hypothetical protein
MIPQQIADDAASFVFPLVTEILFCHFQCRLPLLVAQREIGP